MKKKDAILGFGVILLAILLLSGMQIIQRVQAKETDESQVVIKIDGKIYGTYSLQEDQVIEVQEGDSYNRIRIKNGKAFMEEANCPDGYCEEQGEISNKMQTIVCLPHKLVVEIEDTDSQTEKKERLPDTISK